MLEKVPPIPRLNDSTIFPCPRTVISTNWSTITARMVDSNFLPMTRFWAQLLLMCNDTIEKDHSPLGSCRRKEARANTPYVTQPDFPSSFLSSRLCLSTWRYMDVTLRWERKCLCWKAMLVLHRKTCSWEASGRHTEHFPAAWWCAIFPQIASRTQPSSAPVETTRNLIGTWSVFCSFTMSSRNSFELISQRKSSGPFWTYHKMVPIVFSASLENRTPMFK